MPPDARLDEALRMIDAPDAVVGVSRHGRRTLAGADGRVRALRYELGSLTKTFTVLLAARLAQDGVLGLDDPLSAHLPVRATPITLRHLATHTSGLPRVPYDLLPGALLHPRRNPYTGYGTGRLLAAFSRARPRHAPGTRWNYSNFGVSLLGLALSRTTGTPYARLLDERVLTPLGLTRTSATPAPTDAVGHRKDGTTRVPCTSMGAFAPAASVRATPGDLLTYTEAHLAPSGPLADALRRVVVPQLRRGRHGEGHTLTWFVHETPRGPLLFHSGATFGQQAFAGFHPASGTAVVAVANRHHRGCRLVPVAHDLLYGLATQAPGREEPVALGTGW
ncbi:beta-lactamase family protein [Streptomyces roseirectus]|uniref:Beta-lactamase family protein n=1 Tax=Streptomyces roseirectus TaxID=2768066 RepID=A0A7H0INH9_9ACTN|nr:serine hydrolase domain-containing protein [Streptomyces roseirectus]QNP74345.1 beta-lactamase family protein [Streptomyces roseirectus]